MLEQGMPTDFDSYDPPDSYVGRLLGQRATTAATINLSRPWALRLVVANVVCGWLLHSKTFLI